LGRKRWMDKILFIDELTGAFNRNSLTDTYQRLLSDSLRNSTPFSLAFMDIDHFKKVNDTHGHLVGDVVLSRFASFIKTNSGKYDILFRYGGEEFLLLMPRTSGQDAKQRIKQLLVDFQALSFESAEGSFSLSFSAGVVQIEDGQKPLSHWIDAADTALYAAKNNGRCRVEMAKRNDDPDTRTVRLKVAIIDDDSLTRTLLADCARASLEGWIHTDIRTFHEGAAFFESSWHQGPEAYLVILDGIMPHMDGLDVLRLIRALPNSKQYTVLMLTGRSGEQDIARALQLGADDYMTKPFSIKELEARIKRLIKRMM
ncbi:diguanylate cyclase, partial [Mesorhizobium sp. M00.F.Ca.ET.186.01.1.1]